MKKLFLASLIALMSIGAVNAQEQKKNESDAANQHGPKIVFAEKEHNYGTIQKGGDGNCSFTFTNTGDAPTPATSPSSSAASAPAAAAPLPNGPRSPSCPAKPVKSEYATTPTV